MVYQTMPILMIVRDIQGYFTIANLLKCNCLQQS